MSTNNTPSHGTYNSSVLLELVVQEREYMKLWLDAQLQDREELKVANSLSELIFGRLERRLTNYETANVEQNVQSGDAAAAAGVDDENMLNSSAEDGHKKTNSNFEDGVQSTTLSNLLLENQIDATVKRLIATTSTNINWANDDEEFDQETLDAVKKEIEDEERELALKNCVVPNSQEPFESHNIGDQQLSDSAPISNEQFEPHHTNEKQLQENLNGDDDDDPDLYDKEILDQIKIENEEERELALMNNVVEPNPIPDEPFESHHISEDHSQNSELTNAGQLIGADDDAKQMLFDCCGDKQAELRDDQNSVIEEENVDNDDNDNDENDQESFEKVKKEIVKEKRVLQMQMQNNPAHMNQSILNPFPVSTEHSSTVSNEQFEHPQINEDQSDNSTLLNIAGQLVGAANEQDGDDLRIDKIDDNQLLNKEMVLLDSTDVGLVNEELDDETETQSQIITNDSQSTIHFEKDESEDLNGAGDDDDEQHMDFDDEEMDLREPQNEVIEDEDKHDDDDEDDNDQQVDGNKQVELSDIQNEVSENGDDDDETVIDSANEDLLNESESSEDEEKSLEPVRQKAKKLTGAAAADEQQVDGDEQVDLRENQNEVIEDVNVDGYDDDDDTVIDSANEDFLNEDNNESSEDEEESRPARKPKTNRTNQTRRQQTSSSRSATNRKSPSLARKSNNNNKTNGNKLHTNSSETVNQSNKYIILSLKCHQLECAQVFVQPNALNKLNAHMKNVHKAERCPCLVRDCGQSFKKKSLASHVKTAHEGHTTQWSCGKCDLHFTAYDKLYIHNYQCHHLIGQYQCVNPKCTFTSEYHVKMTNHYEHCKYRPEKWQCKRVGCAFRTNRKYLLEVHERAHIGAKPYRCTWPKCEHANATERHALMHIKVKHFKCKPSSNGLDKPEDYLKVLNHGKKRPRINNTETECAKKRKLTTDDVNDSEKDSTQKSSTTNEVVNQVMDRQFITLSLRCHQLECKEVFVQPDALKKLNDHLWERHLIGPFRCLHKDCGKSFNNNRLLGSHLKQDHRKRDTSQLHCAKCDKHYTSHPSLSQHNTQVHHLGVYQCAQPSCTLTFEYKTKLYDHFAAEHKTELGCKWRGCQFKHKNSAFLAAHERSHRGAKPYQCKWPGCVYAHASQLRTMTHIRYHLKAHKQNLNQNGRKNKKQPKSKDYLRVVHSLL